MNWAKGITDIRPPQLREERTFGAFSLSERLTKAVVSLMKLTWTPPSGEKRSTICATFQSFGNVRWKTCSLGGSGSGPARSKYGTSGMRMTCSLLRKGATSGESGSTLGRPVRGCRASLSWDMAPMRLDMAMKQSPVTKAS